MHDETPTLLARPDEFATAPIVVGFSGGLDSTVLLHRLANDAARHISGLRALHIDHGLHADASQWAAHAERTCRALGIDSRTIVVEVDRNSGLGLEAAARQARRTAFAAELRAGEVLALAQHRDDQAETFLLRALRASGPDGLGSMRPWRRFAAGGLWRPLLDTPRSALIAYAEHHGLRWIDDPSNDDLSLDRNFLRHRVLPLLRERWPHADAAFARSAELSARTADLLRDEDARMLEHVRLDGRDILSRQALRGLASERRARVLRHWVQTCGAAPLPAEGVARIETDLLRSARDRLPAFAWQGHNIVAWRDGLYCLDDREQDARMLPEDMSLDWDGRTSLILPNNDRLQLVGGSTLPWRLRVHARRGGERIQLPGREHRHALKHVLQDLGIPPWQRARMPLLSREDGMLMAAGDRIVSADFADWLETSGSELQWLRTETQAVGLAAGNDA